jgi:hypothetical protein
VLSVMKRSLHLGREDDEQAPRVLRAGAFQEHRAPYHSESWEKPESIDGDPCRRVSWSVTGMAGGHGTAQVR